MSNNIGSTDRTLRIIGGLIVIAIGLYYNSWLGAIGLIPLMTGILRWCPLYSIFGIQTCSKQCANNEKCCPHSNSK